MLKVGLPIALAIIMFGMGLGLTVADFTRVFRKPRAFLTGAGRVIAAPTDFPVLQGRLGIDQAVRLLQGELAVKHAGPAVEMVDASNVDALGPEESLAPAWFKPTFTVE